MYYALNSDGTRISIEHANTEEQYFCPVCGGEVIIKRGDINAHHFAHKTLTECDEWSSDMSDWHKNWQEKFPEECREVVVERNGKKHRADVLVHKTVIEFQHSPISWGEFEERSTFYQLAGYNVCWLFDVSDDFEEERLNFSDTTDNLMLWKYAKKMFGGFKKAKGTPRIFFQLGAFDDVDDEHRDWYEIPDFSIIEAIWFSDDASRIIFSDEVFGEEEFAEHFVSPSKVKKLRATKDASGELYDEFPEFRLNLDWQVRCPKNNFEFKSFDYCNGCKHNISEFEFEKTLPCEHCVACKYRFENYLNNKDRRVINVDKRNGMVSKIDYIENGKQDSISFYSQNGMKLDDIIRMSKAHTIKVMNLASKCWFRISNIDYFKNPKYELTRIFGNYSSNGRNFGSENREIYYWDKPNWVLEWEK